MIRDEDTQRIENQISDLLAELSQLQSDDDKMRTCSQWVVVGQVVDVDGDEYTVHWTPTSQKAWVSLGLLRVSQMTEETQIQEIIDDDEDDY